MSQLVSAGTHSDGTSINIRVGSAYKLLPNVRPEKASHAFGEGSAKMARITVPYAVQPTKVATVDALNRRVLTKYPGPYGLVWVKLDNYPGASVEFERLDKATWAAVELGALPMPYIALAAYLNVPGCTLIAQGSGEDRWARRQYYPVYGFEHGVCKLLPLDEFGLDQPNVYVAAYQMAYKPDYRLMLNRKLP